MHIVFKYFSANRGRKKIFRFFPCSPGGGLCQQQLTAWLQVVGQEYVDARVVEAHIVPGQLLLTSLIPTQEVSTVAWDPAGVKVNVSLQPSYAQEGSVMVR